MEQARAAAVRCLRGRFGMGEAPRLDLALEIGRHPVWRHGSAQVWRALRDDRVATYAVTHADRVSVVVAAPAARLHPREAWEAHVGEALLATAPLLFQAELPRHERTDLERRLQAPPFWEGCWQLGAARVVIGRLLRMGRLHRVAVGPRAIIVEERPLGTLLLLQIALGRWWLRSEPD